MSQIKKLQLGGTTLHYGTDKVVDANEFNEKIASEVEDYIASLNWSKKEKDRFREAYKDIMSRGVTGMEVIDGIRNTTYNGEQIDNKTLAKKLRESYGNAAYFINEQLEKSAYNPEERAKQEKEKEEKEEKARIDALPKHSSADFDKFFIKTVFGGQENPNISDWDDLDEVDSETHYRSTKNRIAALDKILEQYIEQLPEQNYEGSAFKNVTDYKEKLEKARAALKLGDFQEIKQALNAAGINWKHFLEVDTLTPEGRQAFDLRKEQATKQAAQQAALLVEQEAKLKVEEDKKAEEETGIEILEPVLEDEKEEESKDGKDKYANMGIAELWKKDPVYMAEILGSLGMDVASIIDVEPFSAAGLGLGAAGLRNAAAARSGEKWKLGDYIVQYGAGLLGAVPVIGDYALGARAAKTLTNFVKYGGKALAAYFALHGGSYIIDKILKKEKLSFKDWKLVADILLGLNSLKASKTGKAANALNAARGVKQKGTISFNIKDTNGNIKKLKVEIDAAPDDEIWGGLRGLRRMSPAKQRELLGNNEQVKAALNREGVKADAILLKNNSIVERGRNLVLGSKDIEFTRGESHYTKRLLTEDEVNAIADQNAGILSNKRHNRGVYQRVNRELSTGRAPFGIRRTLGGRRPQGARTEFAQIKTPTWLGNSLRQPGDFKIFGKKINGAYPYKLTRNADGTYTLSNSLSASGKTDYIIENQADMDKLLGIFGKVDKVIISGGKPKVVGKPGKYRTQADKDAAYEKLFQDFGIFRFGGKIYNNLDSYLTDFLIRNK